MSAARRLLVLATAVSGLLVALGTPAASGAPGVPGAPGAPGDPASVTGRLVATVSDEFAEGRSETLIGVEDDEGGLVRLTGVERADVAHLVGRTVTARGRSASGGAVRVAASDVRPAGSSGDAGSVAEAARVPHPTGPRTISVLAVVIRFADDPTATTPSTSSVSSRLFSGAQSVKGYYSDATDGLWTLTGRAVGPYTVTRPRADSCTRSDYTAWASAAADAALARGADPADHDHLMVVLPTPARAADDPCGWAGLAEVPGDTSWINEQTPTVRVMAHELGHNFGEGHASTYRCTSGGSYVPLAEPGSCTPLSEYGDPFSVMGMTTRLHHAVSRQHFRLLNPRDLEGGEAETVRLAPADSITGIRELRIDRGDGTWLTVEYRRPTGIFDSFSPGDPVVTGVTVRLESGPVDNTWLVDLRPSTTSGADAPMQPGGALVDPVTGSRIALVRADADAATVRVTSATAVDGLRVTRSGRTLTAWWSAPAGASGPFRYEVALDHGTPVSTTDRRWSATTSRGAHTVSVRAVDGSGTVHPWSHVDVVLRSLG